MAFDKQRADAQKLLGKDAKIPKDKGVAKDSATANKCVAEVTKASDDLKSKLLAWKKALQASTEGLEAFKDDIEGTDFDVDLKDAEQKKKVPVAQKMFVDAIDPNLKQNDVLVKLAEEVYKTLANWDKRFDELANL